MGKNTSKKKVCIPAPHKLSLGRDLLEKAGCELVLGKDQDQFPKHRYTEDELVQIIGDSDVVWAAQRDTISASVLTRCPQLRGVVKAAIGYETIDVAEATKLGILVCNSPARENFTGVAEATVGLMSMLFKRLIHNQNVIREGNWKKHEHRGNLMAGRTIGLVGLGRVGKETAKRLGPWEMRLIGCDPYITQESVDPLGVELMSLDEVLRESDLVSFHVTLTDETRHLITLEQLKKMKPTAYLVNTSRGGVIKQDDIAQALNEGIIAGAALDVFEDEPLPMSDPIRSVDPERLIMTPHIIGTNPQSQVAGEQMTAESILALLAGKAPGTVVNPAAIDAWTKKFAHNTRRSSIPHN